MLISASSAAHAPSRLPIRRTCSCNAVASNTPETGLSACTSAKKASLSLPRKCRACAAHKQPWPAHAVEEIQWEAPQPSPTSSSVLLQRCRKLNVTCQEAFRHRESASPRPEPPENGAAAVQRIDSGGATARHFLLFCHRGLHQPSARILCCWTRFAAATVQAALLLSVQCRQRGCSVARLRTF